MTQSSIRLWGFLACYLAGALVSFGAVAWWIGSLHTVPGRGGIAFALWIFGLVVQFLAWRSG